LKCIRSHDNKEIRHNEVKIVQCDVNDNSNNFSKIISGILALYFDASQQPFEYLNNSFDSAPSNLKVVPTKANALTLPLGLFVSFSGHPFFTNCSRLG
jgi:hypothetical protein